MGRQKQPIEVLEMRGKSHLTKAEIEERKAQEIKAPSGNITAPAYLTKEQTENFYRLAGQLHEIGILADIDADVLAQYVAMHEDYVRVTRSLRKLKPLNPEYQSLARLQNTYLKTLRSYANDLGLNVMSRCKLTSTKKEEKPPENKFERYFS